MALAAYLYLSLARVSLSLVLIDLLRCSRSHGVAYAGVSSTVDFDWSKLTFVTCRFRLPRRRDERAHATASPW